MRLWLLLMVGCKFKASTVVVDSGGESGIDTGSAEDSGADDDPADTGAVEDTGDPPNLPESDDDEDGYTELEGDCDDEDENIRPGLEDGCDGVDNDCDDRIDEDAHAEDTYEPNDAIDYNLGDLDAAGSFEVVGFLSGEDDVDSFRFEYTDGWDWDSLTVTLSDLSPDIAYKMTVVDIDNDLEVYGDFSTADDEALIFELESSIFSSDSAVFRVRISSLGGYGCITPYTLSIVHDDWWGLPPG